MMESEDLPPPYSVVVDVSTPTPDVLVTQQEILNKPTVDEVPLVAHHFDDKLVRLAFMQKVLLLLLLQAFSVLAIMALIAVFLQYYNGTLYAIIFLCLYLLMVGLVFFSETARTKQPYKTVFFAAHPVIFAILIASATFIYSPIEIFVAWSSYCVALFALLSYSILIFKTSLEYRPSGGIFISTVVLASLFALSTQIPALGTSVYLACYMLAVLVNCSYIAWALYLIASPKYRYTVTPSDIILGVLLIRTDFLYYMSMGVKKSLKAYRIIG